jgi:hypothetical protein
MNSFHIPPEHPLSQDIKIFLSEKRKCKENSEFGLNISERTEIGFGTIYAISPQKNILGKIDDKIDALSQKYPTIYQMLLESTFTGTDDIKVYVLRNIQQQMIWHPKKTSHQKMMTAQRLKEWMLSHH